MYIMRTEEMLMSNFSGYRPECTFISLLLRWVNSACQTAARLEKRRYGQYMVVLCFTNHQPPIRLSSSLCSNSTNASYYRLVISQTSTNSRDIIPLPTIPLRQRTGYVCFCRLTQRAIWHRGDTIHISPLDSAWCQLSPSSFRT